jgi:hypothetical protein
MTFENQIFCAKLFYITRKYLIGIFNEYQLLLLSAYKLNNLHFNADLQKSNNLHFNADLQKSDKNNWIFEEY